jgi:hypothetical protein
MLSFFMENWETYVLGDVYGKRALMILSARTALQ